MKDKIQRLIRCVADIQDNNGLYAETKYEAINALCEAFKNERGC